MLLVRAVYVGAELSPELAKVRKGARLLPNEEYSGDTLRAIPDLGIDVATPMSADAIALGRYQRLFSHMAEGVVFQDAAGRIIDANPAALRLLGLTLDQLQGNTSFYSRRRVIHLDGTEIRNDQHPALVALRTGRPVTEEILGMYDPVEERYRWLRVNAIPQVLAGSERPAEVIVTFSDITHIAGWDNMEHTASIQEARYQALMEQAVDAVFVADLEGHYIEVNTAACTLLGYPREELLSKRIVDLILPEEVPHLVAVREELLRGGTHRGEWHLRRKDEVVVPVEVSTRMMPDGRWQAIARDISERKRLEQELRERTEELTRTFEAIQEGVYIYDRSGALLQMNAAARSLAGYDIAPELARESAHERLSRLRPRDASGRLLPREEWPIVRALRGETISPAAPVELMVTTATRRESIRQITGAPVRDADGQIVGAVTVTRDITERRRLERDLAARAQEIERVFETDADAVMLFDSQGRTIRMNTAQKRLLGYEATGRANYIRPKERARRFAISDTQGRPLTQEAWPIARVLRGETLVGAQAMEMRLRTLDGRELWVSVSGSPLLDEQGRIVGGVTATRDVTELRRLEQQRTDILNVVAHDLANPLVTLKMYVQMQQRRLARGQTPRIPDAELLETLAGEVTRMERLLGDMRVVVGLEANELPLDRAPVDLVILCQQEVRSLQLSETRELRVHLPEEPVMVEADRDRIGQVLANLLINADKYSPIERPVTLTLRIESGAPANDAPANWQAARVLVQDEGPGIPLYEQEHIWERFHRVAGASPDQAWGVAWAWGSTSAARS